jgi:GT2 family glycosyltransferase
MKVSERLIQYLKRRNISGTFIDIGATNGMYSRAFVKIGAASVLAIEPRCNFPISKRIVQHRIVAGTRDEVTEVPTGGTIIRKSPSWYVLPTTKVKTVRVDSIAKEAALIRLNVKDPADALRSCKRILENSRPYIVFDTTLCSPEAIKEVHGILDLWLYARGTLPKWNGFVYAPVDVHISVITYNRPQLLSNLLSDLAKQIRIGTSVKIYDDASTKPMEAAREKASEEGFGWHRFSVNNGKKGFWKIFNKVFADCRQRSGHTIFIFLPDDVRICHNFIGRALSIWNGIIPSSKSCLTLQAERYRDKHPCWTGFKPVSVNDNVVQTQWVDGLFLCTHRSLKVVGYKIPEQSTVRWVKDPTKSSGVWEHFSKQLHAKGHGMYRVKKSLVIHVAGESKMHGDLRQKQPIAVHNFIDGASAHAKLLTTEPIQASLASIPSRINNLRRVVKSLEEQADVVRVYLNGYDSTPGFLKKSNIIVVRSQDHGDLGDAGKFFWSENAKGYQFTCDDDLIYPPGYIVHMIEAIERHGKKSVVGLHGIIMHPQIGNSYYRSRDTIHWRLPLRQDRPVHLLGTGALAYHASAICVRVEDFKKPNMADIWFGVLCQKQRVPAHVIAHPGHWLQHLKSPWTIYDRAKNSDHFQASIARGVVWSLKRTKK